MIFWSITCIHTPLIWTERFILLPVITNFPIMLRIFHVLFLHLKFHLSKNLYIFSCWPLFGIFEIQSCSLWHTFACPLLIVGSHMVQNPYTLDHLGGCPNYCYWLTWNHPCLPVFVLVFHHRFLPLPWDTSLWIFHPSGLSLSW